MKTDRERYLELIAIIHAEAGKPTHEGMDTKEFQQVWTELENIKRRYKGMPPPEPAKTS